MNSYLFWAYAVTAVSLFGYALWLRQERLRRSSGRK